MSLVEWTRLGGDQVEELTAILLCRKYPKAIRIRPSVGDGGIDLLVPNGSGAYDVFQVKKFASNLSSSQKSQIKGSLDHLDKYRADHDKEVSAWHLVLPLDPTNENLEWLSELTKDLAYPCDWRGLSFLEGLIAEFPDVRDYYLGGGKGHLEIAISQLTSALGMKPNEGDGVVAPAQIADYLQSLAPVLDTDPHFKYEISVGPLKPYITTEPGIVYETMISAGVDNQSVVTVKVFVRFEAALDFRPIPIEVIIRAEPGSALVKELASFKKYGTSLSAPAGTVDIKADLPGGFGGTYTNASMRIIPFDSMEATPSHTLRLVAVNPDGEKVVSVLIDMNSPSFGLDGTGARVTGAERGGNFEIEILTDNDAKSTKLIISNIDIDGNPPHEVAKAMRFLDALRSPNRLAVAAPQGPFKNSMALPDDFLLPDSAFLAWVTQVASALVAIQNHTTTQLKMSNSFTYDETKEWLLAARLLEGNEETVQTDSIRVCLEPNSTVPEGKFAMATYSDYSVAVRADKIALGTILTHCPIVEANPESIEQHGNHIDCSFRVADGAIVTARLVSTA